MSSSDETSLKKLMSDHNLPSFYDRNVQKQKAKGTCCCKSSSTPTAKSSTNMAEIQLFINQNFHGDRATKKDPSILSCHPPSLIKSCWGCRCFACIQQSMDFMFHTSTQICLRWLGKQNIFPKWWFNEDLPSKKTPSTNPSQEKKQASFLRCFELVIPLFSLVPSQAQLAAGMVFFHRSSISKGSDFCHPILISPLKIQLHT